MRNQKSICSFFIAIFLAIAMLSNAFTTIAFAAKEQNVDQDPNSNDFMALSKYTTPTDIPGVFQVTLTIEPPEIKPPTIYATLVLDASGSMGQADIWNSQTGTWINRRDAVKGASQQFVNTMVDSGNQDIYIDIIWFGGPVATPTAISGTGGFKKLFPTGNGVPDTGFTNLIGSGGYMAAYGGNQSTPIATGLQKAYTDLQIANPPAKSNRFVLLLTDGADTSSPSNAPQVAAALKAPTSMNVSSIWTSAPAPSNGMGATIWSVVLGGANLTNMAWKTQWLSSTVNPVGSFSDWVITSPTVSGAPRDSLGVPNETISAQAEGMMISHAIDLGDDGTAYGNGTFPSSEVVGSYTGVHQFYKTALNTAALVNGENVNYYFSMNMKQSNPTYAYKQLTPVNGIYHYEYVPVGTNSSNNSVAALDIFDNFAKAALGAAGETEATDILGGNFELYKMDGIEMLVTDTNDPDPDVNMKASYKGDTLSWTFDKLNGGYRYTLQYYVKYTGPESEKNLWHATNKDAYIKYINNDQKMVIKNFPVPYSKPSTNEVKVENTSVTDEIQMNASGDTTMTNPNTATGSNATTSGVEMIGIVPSFANALPTYTSSNQKIETIKDKVVIYQKTTSGKYKAVATVNKGKTFTVISEESDYYKIIYQMKDAKKASTGYIKKLDAKLLANTATTSTAK